MSATNDEKKTLVDSHSGDTGSMNNDRPWCPPLSINRRRTLRLSAGHPMFLDTGTAPTRHWGQGLRLGGPSATCIEDVQDGPPFLCVTTVGDGGERGLMLLFPRACLSRSLSCCS